ncbi:hypothetical protein [Streptomyces sp. NRRL S-340]|uniref:hypothetical protein n=1 Tax=Streptomyces sp. NRRL S-340 TaxID=1463901 RepID=UPI00131ADE2D|nr:hypothetical protein [Streptomyces sp. NRRL S-340]
MAYEAVAVAAPGAVAVTAREVAAAPRTAAVMVPGAVAVTLPEAVTVTAHEVAPVPRTAPVAAHAAAVLPRAAVAAPHAIHERTEHEPRPARPRAGRKP